MGLSCSKDDNIKTKNKKSTPPVASTSNNTAIKDDSDCEDATLDSRIGLDALPANNRAIIYDSDRSEASESESDDETARSLKDNLPSHNVSRDPKRGIYSDVFNKNLGDPQNKR